MLQQLLESPLIPANEVPTKLHVDRVEKLVENSTAGVDDREGHLVGGEGQAVHRGGWSSKKNPPQLLDRRGFLVMRK